MDNRDHEELPRDRSEMFAAVLSESRAAAVHEDDVCFRLEKIKFEPRLNL